MRLLWMLLTLLVANCAVPAAPLIGPDPSDSTAKAPKAVYRSTIGAYVRQRPVEPHAWSEQNEPIAPKQKR